MLCPYFNNDRDCRVLQRKIHAKIGRDYRTVFSRPHTSAARKTHKALNGMVLDYCWTPRTLSETVPERSMSSKVSESMMIR